MIEGQTVASRPIRFARQIGEGGDALAEGRGINECFARRLALLQLLQAALGLLRLFPLGEESLFGVAARSIAASTPLIVASLG